jgi:hypothetical protein
MITEIKKIGDSTYLINECIKLTINPDTSCTADFDETVITEDEVNAIIDSFFEGVKKRIEEQSK